MNAELAAQEAETIAAKTAAVKQIALDARGEADTANVNANEAYKQAQNISNTYFFYHTFLLK